MLIVSPGEAGAFTLRVIDTHGQPVSGFRWLVEEDTTLPVPPGVQSPDTLSLNIHHVYSPNADNGETADASVEVALPDTRPYFVSVLPTSGYSMGGMQVPVGQDEVTVMVHANPQPTAQIKVLAFHDNRPLNNAPDHPVEEGLEGFTVIIKDFLGQVMTDGLGNPLGTTYDEKGNMIQMGGGVITTDANGEALIKNLAPGKYGVVIIPPAGEGWIQTSTIEGTPTVDAWVQSDEPPYLAEWGFFEQHVFTGFAKLTELTAETPEGESPGSISGQMVYVHENKPPLSPGLHVGLPVPNCYIGLNDLDHGDELVYLQPCDKDSNFSIQNVPPGQYQLAMFDKYLDAIIDFRTVNVGSGENIDMGPQGVYAWFGTLEGSVFFDANQDGYPDDGEAGIAGQAVNIRWPDGSVYQTTATDRNGAYSFDEVFPFFHWMTVEVDFARFKATGATFVVDDGGELPAGEKRTPQPQPENGGMDYRTESGVVLTEGMLLYAGGNNRIDFGKSVYADGENGGITGIVYYATTRAENDPAYAVGEEWEIGIPNVQINLYADFDRDNLPDDVNEDGAADSLDIIQTVFTDSWDDSQPAGCVAGPYMVHGQQVMDCAETLRNYNQMRPAIFNGGYAFDSYVPGGLDSGQEPVDGLPSGTYIVEVVPPAGYELVKEEDKNVDYGDSYMPKSLPVPCVGEDHEVPAMLSLFGDIEAPFAGQMRPLCDRKSVYLNQGRNAAADFFLFTKVPKAGRIWGMVFNDVLLEFDPNSPQAGNNYGVPWLPVSIRDWTGEEVARVYTDEWGKYNAMVPSTYTVNVACPSGVSPNILSACINDPGPIEDPDNPGTMIRDPWYDPRYSQTCTKWDFWPGRTNTLDTPILPIAAFAGSDKRLDCEYPDGTPVIFSADGPSDFGPWVPRRRGGVVTLRSVGDIKVPNPDYSLANPGAGDPLITRDMGFGGVEGTVTLNGEPLQIQSWAADGSTIEVVIPSNAASGQLMVTRGDNGLQTNMGITLHVGSSRNVLRVRAGESIQAAIDSARPNTVILIEPGVYFEHLILYKNLTLQGSGAFSTVIQSGPLSQDEIDVWEAKLQSLIDAGDIDLIPGERPDFYLETAAAITVASHQGVFHRNSPARIDGLGINGAIKGGGILVNGWARYLHITNNRLIGNQGNFGGGIRIGTPALQDQGAVEYVSSQNQQMVIQNNQILNNGAVDGGGGISLFKGADDYRISENYICGNFTLLYGGGIAHTGLSPDGVISKNKILFNQSFDEGGGIMLTGELPPANADPGTLSEGVGSVTIDGNLIQGNLGGDDGGGLRTLMFSGQDVAMWPDNERQWHHLSVTNNIIVDNSSADAGGGISLDDTASVSIVHNTIAHNDSTSTGGDAFGGPCTPGSPPGQICAGEGEGIGGLINSVPQVAGIASRRHSQELIDSFSFATAQTYSDPYLYNNIIFQNRSFYWDASYNGGTGGLRPDIENGEQPVYWDLAVYPALAENPPNQAMLRPQYCVLTDITGYAATNVAGDPMFAGGYFNTYDATSKGAAFGNMVVTSFLPLQPGGDYHIGSDSAATGLADAGALDDSALLAFDYDNEPRTGSLDSGADQRAHLPGAGFLANLGSMIRFAPRATLGFVRGLFDVPQSKRDIPEMNGGIPEANKGGAPDVHEDAPGVPGEFMEMDADASGVREDISWTTRVLDKVIGFLRIFFDIPQADETVSQVENEAPQAKGGLQ